jgi:hypothetical protein
VMPVTVLEWLVKSWMRLRIWVRNVGVLHGSG